MTREEVIARCRRFVEENYLYMHPALRLRDEDDLFETGVLDSTGAIELVSFVEEAFGFTVDDLEITTENFGSLRRLGDYVTQKLGNGHALAGR